MSVMLPPQQRQCLHRRVLCSARRSAAPSSPLSTVLLLLLFAMCVLLCDSASAALCDRVCRPWGLRSDACRRRQRLDLRFRVDVAVENAWTLGTTTVDYATYAFCPVVDQLQSFSLSLAPFLATAYNTTAAKATNASYALTLGPRTKYISVYGFGSDHQRLTPEQGSTVGSVLLAVDGTRVCGTANSVAVVTMLLLDIGLHNGQFNYFVPMPDYDKGADGDVVSQATATTPPVSSHDNNDNRGSSSSSSSRVPVEMMAAKTGFVPTCNTDDVCQFDKSLYCIGDVPGRKNCAMCVVDASVLPNLTLKVWASYYGTDAKGRYLTSGSLNPLNYLPFARTNVLQQIAYNIRDTWNWLQDFRNS